MGNRKAIVPANHKRKKTHNLRTLTDNHENGKEKWDPKSQKTQKNSFLFQKMEKL